MEIRIEEDKNRQQGSANYAQLMTDEQVLRGQFYADEYLMRRAEVDAEVKIEWDYLQSLYECVRTLPDDADEDAPKSFVPVITPCVDGQVASMMESDIDFRHVSDIPGYEPIVRVFDAASEYYRKKNGFMFHFKDFGRNYELLGNSWVTISWEKSFANNKRNANGLPRLVVPPPLSVLVDGSIKDFKDLQYARYIIREIGYQSIAWARKEYGDKYADALCATYNRKDGIDTVDSYDDTDTFMLLHVWTRSNPEGNLQLIEMDVNGLILRESDPSEPYYKYVNNEYPFGFARMIPQNGRFYGKGDGHVLRYIQETVNNLTDELELAARFNAQARTYIDSKAHCAAEQLTSNPSDIVYCDDPKNNILIVPGVGVSPTIQSMINFLLTEAQKATRFHESMTGNTQGSSATATQINTQISQGSVGIKDKKADLSRVMAWADTYALKICLENWNTPFWASMGDDYSEWIDLPSIRKIPALIPKTAETMNKELQKKSAMRKNNSSASYYETLFDKEGKAVDTDVDFYTKVIIGNAIPKGRTDMYNIMLGLSQLKLLNDDGTVTSLVSAKRVRQIMEDVLGMKLKTPQEVRDERKQALTEQNPLLSDQLNPVGNNNTVQTPTAGNLAQTVPQMPNQDSRKVQM